MSLPCTFVKRKDDVQESESDETKTLAPSSKHQNLKSLISDERGSSGNKNFQAMRLGCNCTNAGEPSSIGEIFVERGDLLKLYAVYCSNQPNIAKRLREYRVSVVVSLC